MPINSVEKLTPSTNEALRQALQDLQKELPGQTVETAITSIREMIQKVETQIQQDKIAGKDTTEFEKYRDKLSSSLEELQKQNSEDKTKTLHDIGMGLSILQDTVASSTPLQATAISVEKSQNSKEATIETNKESTNTLAITVEMIKEFQTVVGSRLQEKMSRGFDTISLKEGLGIISELGTFQNLPDTIDTKEKEILQKQMPLVNGIIGSLFVGQIFDAGYNIAFNGDNTITMKPKQNFSGTNKSNEFIIIINDAIKANPEIANIMKAGLLYRDQDLLRYATLRTGHDGTISSEAQEASEFINFLKTRTNNSDSARAIVDSREFFGNNYKLSTEINALQYLKDIPLGSAIQGISEAPTSVNTTQNATSGSDERNEGYQTGVGALAGTVARTSSSQKKNWDEIGADFSERPLGTLLRETGNVVGAGLKEIFRDPANFTGVLVLLLAGRWISGSWKGAFGALGVLTIGAGMLGRYKEVDKTQDYSNKTTTQIRIHEKLTEVVPQEKINQHHEDVHRDNPDIIDTIKGFYSENYREITRYLKNEGGELSNASKQSLADPTIKEALQKEINTINPEFQKRLNIAFTDTKDREEILQNMNYGQAIRFSKMTDEDARQVAISTLNSLIENTTDPQEKQELQAVLDKIKKGLPPVGTGNGQPPEGPQTTTGEILRTVWQVAMWAGAFVVGGALIVGAYKAGKWRERGSMISRAVNTITGKGKPTTPSTPNTPNNYIKQSHVNIDIPQQSDYPDKKTYKAALEQKKVELDNQRRLIGFNKQINASIRVIDEELAILNQNDTINKQIRPFADAKALQKQSTTLETLQNNIEDLERKAQGTPAGSLERTALNQAKDDLRQFEQSNKIQYHVNGVDIDLTPSQALEYDKAIQTLKQHSGQQMMIVNKNGRSSDMPAKAEVEKAIRDINNILSAANTGQSTTGWTNITLDDLLKEAKTTTKGIVGKYLDLTTFINTGIKR